MVAGLARISRAGTNLFAHFCFATFDPLDILFVATMRDPSTRGTSKASHRSRHSSRKQQHAKVARSLLDSQTSESANATMDPPSTNLEVMANCVQPPADADLKRHKIKESLILANFGDPQESGQKNVSIRIAVGEKTLTGLFWIRRVSFCQTA